LAERRPKQEGEHQFRQFTASLAFAAFSQSWTENNLNENSITASWGKRAGGGKLETLRRQ